MPNILSKDIKVVPTSTPKVYSPVYVKLLGKAIVFSTAVMAFGAVLMNSAYSVKLFAKSQEKLELAAIHLRRFLIIAAIWTVGASMLMYAEYGLIGVVTVVIACSIVIGWIYFTHQEAFTYASQKYQLKSPNLIS